MLLVVPEWMDELPVSTTAAKPKPAETHVSTESHSVSKSK
jgi:hypothetical protein